MTERLFDRDSYIKTFKARVLSSSGCDGHYATVLDKTAFFPEGGGQSADTGKIGYSTVSDVYEKDGVIYHVTDCVMRGEVECKIDFSERFRKMQNHTGEHILSGIVCRKFGYTNVGFHLSDKYVRVDFSGELDEGQIAEVEREANRVVWDNRQVTAWYPEESELESLEYRSKGEIEGKVRIVEIEGCDRCACCAPHVSSTGEVGLIKVVDFMKYKGGSRLFMVCGSDALDLVQKEHTSLTKCAVEMSVKREEVYYCILRIKEENHKIKQEMARAFQSAMKGQLEILEYTEGNLCFFFENFDMKDLREFVNGAVAKCSGAVGAFVGADGDYKYIIASNNIDLKPLISQINSALHARGGGSSRMLQGSAEIGEKEVREFFEKCF